jgi:hypothetical protein
MGNDEDGKAKMATSKPRNRGPSNIASLELNELAVGGVVADLWKIMPACKGFGQTYRY